MKTKKSVILIVLFSLTLAICGSIAIIDLVQREVQVLAIRALDKLQSTIVDTTGLILKYDYLDIESLNRFSMHGIELIRSDPLDQNNSEFPSYLEFSLPSERSNYKEQPPLKINKLSVRISFWALFAGQNNEAVRDITVDDVQISLYFPNDEYIINKILANFVSGKAKSLPHFELSIGPIRAEVREIAKQPNSSIDKDVINGGSLTIESLQFSSLTDSPVILAPSVILKANGLFGLPKELNAEFSLRGSGNADLSNIDMNIELQASSTNWHIIPQQLLLQKRGSRIECEREGGGGLVRGWYESGEWGLEGVFEGYRAGEDIGVGGVWGNLVRGSEVSGKVEVGGKGKELVGYEVDLGIEIGEGIEIFGKGVGGIGVRLKGVGDIGRYIGEVSVVKGGGKVRYEGEVGYEGIRLVGRYEVSGEGIGIRGEVRGGGGAYEIGVEGGGVKGIGVGAGICKVKVGEESYEVRYEGVIGGGEVKLGGSIGKLGGYEGVVELEGVGIGKVMEAIGVRGVEGKVRGRIYGLERGGKISWSISGLGYEGEVMGIGVGIRGEGVGDEKGYEIKGLEVSIGSYDIGLRGKGIYGGELFSGEVSGGGMRYEVRVGIRGGEVRVEVGKECSGVFEVSGGRVGGEVGMDNFGIGIGDGVMRLGGKARGWYEGGHWGISLDGISLRYEGEGVYPELRVSGSAGEGGLRFEQLEVIGEGYGFKGSIDLKEEGGRYIFIGSGRGEGALGEGSEYSIWGGVKGKGVELRVGVQGLEVRGYEVEGYADLIGEVDIGELLKGSWEGLGDISGEVAIGLRGSGLSVVEQRFKVSKRGSRIECEREGGGGLVRGWYESGEWGLEGVFEGYRAGEDIGVGGVWGNLVRGSEVSGKVEVGGKGKELVGYEVDLGIEIGEGIEIFGKGVGGIGVRLKGVGDIGRYIGEVSVVKGGGKVRYEGEVGYEGIRLVGRYEVSGEGIGIRGEVRGGGGAYEIGVEGGGVKGIGVGAGICKVKVGEESYEVRYEGVIGGGEVKLGGSIGKLGGYEGVVELEGVGIGKVMEAIGVRGVEGKVRGRIYGLERGGKISWSISGLGYEGEVMGIGVGIRGEGVGDEKGYEIKGLEVSIGSYDIGLRGKGIYGGELFSGEVSGGGMRYEVRVGIRGGEVRVEVGKECSGVFEVSGGRVGGEVGMDNFGIGIGDGVMRLGGKARGWYEGGHWGISLDGISLRYEGEGVYPELRVSGSAGEGGLRFEQLEVIGEGYGFKGSIDLKEEGGRYIFIGSGRGEGALGEGSEYSIWGGVKGKGVELRVGVQGLEVRGYEVEGYADLIGEVDIGELLKGSWEGLGDISGEVAIGLRGSGLSVVEQRFKVSKRGSRIECEREGGGGLVRGWYESGEWGLEGVFEGYRAGEDIGVGGVWGNLVRGSEVSGKVEVGGKGKELVGYEVDLGIEIGEGIEIFGKGVGGIGVRLKGVGDIGRYIGEVSVVKGGGKVRYEGEVGYEGIRLVGRYEVSGEGIGIRGEVRGGGGAYEIGVEGGGVKGIGVGAGICKVKVGEESYEVRYEGVIGGGEVKLGGSIGKLGGYEGVVELEGVGIGKVMEAIGVRGVEGKVRGRIYGLERGGKISWSISGLGYEGEVMGIGVGIRGEGVGDEKGYEIKGLEVSIGSYDIGLRGKGIYGGELFSGEVSGGGMRYEVRVGIRGGEVRVEVGKECSGVFEVSGGRVGGEVGMDNFGIGIGDGVMRLGGKARGWYEGGHWGISLDGISLRYEGEGVYPELRVSGSAGEQEANLNIDYLQYAGQSLKGSMAIQYSSIANLLKDTKINYSFLSIETNRPILEGRIVALDNNLEVSIIASSIPLEEILPSTLNISGDIELKGSATILISGKKFNLSDISYLGLQFNTRKAEMKGISFSASAVIKLKGSALSLESGFFSYQNYRFENINAEYDIDTKQVTYDLNSKIVIGKQLLSARLKGIGENVDDSIFKPDMAQNFNIIGDIIEAKFGSRAIDPLTYSISYLEHNLQIHLSQANGDSIDASINNMTDFDLVLNDLFKVKGKASGKIQANEVSADIVLEKIDLTSLGALISKDILRDISGDASAVLHLSGDISDPRIEGRILFSNFIIDPNLYVLEKMGPFNAEITISDGVVELSPTIVNIGTGDISLAATANLARWQLSDIKVFFSTLEKASMRLKGTIGGLNTDGIWIKGDIKAAISSDFVEIGGNILLDNGTLEVDPNGFVFSENTQSPVSPLYLNLIVTFGKNVQMYIPNKDISLIKGTISPTSTLKVQYDQAKGDLAVNGSIELRSGYIYYLLRDFFIKECTIELSENQSKFNPVMTVIAELMEPSKDGMIKITLSANKSPIDNFNPVLSSVPPKSQIELLALLGGGLALSELAENTPLTLKEAVIASSEFLTHNLVFRSFEQRVQKALGLDVLYLQSSFIQRWLLDITDEAHKDQTNLSKYLIGTGLFGGKYITDSAFAHFSLRIEQNPLEKTGFLQLNPEIGLELQSPFGLLKWSMSFGKEGMPLNNQDLSLSWRINF